jgi:hypothetical protein
LAPISFVCSFFRRIVFRLSQAVKKIVTLDFWPHRFGEPMKFDVHNAGSEATMRLTGRLDISGAETVALPLATLSGSKHDLAVDMAGVTFIASMRLRHLVSAPRRSGGGAGVSSCSFRTKPWPKLLMPLGWPTF